MNKAMMRAIMAMGMETPMPAFAPAESLVEAGEVSCVLEIEVDVLIGELVVDVLVGELVVDVLIGELVVERLVEVVNSPNTSEANNSNIAVSVLCQATGTPSQRIV